VDRFLEVADRKVSLLDDYGDEKWDALPKEIQTCLLKFAQNENDGCTTENAIKEALKNGYDWMVPEKYQWLKTHLESEFREYHEKRSRSASEPEFEELSGTEFETYLARLLKQDGFEIPILPAWRPDNAMNVDNPENFAAYIKRLEAATNIAISNFNDYLFALENRHDYFASMGCTVSDHGLEEIYVEEFTGVEVETVFNKVRAGKELSEMERRKFKSAMLVHFAEWDWEKEWVQQFHLGALRNNNSRMMQRLGADTGWDSIGDFSQGRALAKFLEGM